MSDTQTQPTICFSLTVKNTADALAFYTAAFGATELFRMPSPTGGIFHAEFMIGNTRVYISDEAPDYHANAMTEGTKASCLFSVTVDDCDAAFKQASETEGATVLFEPTDQFWGVRNAMILDPFGYRWTVGQQTEELSPEEIGKRAAALFGG